LIGNFIFYPKKRPHRGGSETINKISLYFTTIYASPHEIAYIEGKDKKNPFFLPILALQEHRNFSKMRVGCLDINMNGVE
jgi:hypothetical protein